MPPPTASAMEMEELLAAPAPIAPVEVPAPASPEDLQARIVGQAEAAEAPQDFAPPEDAAELIRTVLQQMAGEDGATFQPIAAQFQDFTVRCRMRGLRSHGIDAIEFRRRFCAAVAGFDDDPADEQAAQILRLARTVPEELLAPFLSIARAAALGEHCPEDDELARIYGTSSLGRVRRMIENLEKCGAIVVRTDFGGRRTVTIPAMNLTTLAA
jgi:hypothetical protein